MKKLFNAVCTGCRELRPHCATAWECIPNRPAGTFFPDAITLCPACRRGKKYRGKFRLDRRHK
jgi:hypothetical protein